MTLRRGLSLMWFTKNFLGSGGGNALNGALGPMRFYTDDLDPREVANNFQTKRTVFDPLQ